MSAVISAELRAFVESCPVAVLGTSKSDGSPRLATVVFVLDGNRVLISSEAAAAKVGDVSRASRASLCMYGLEPPYPSLSLNGPTRLITDGLGLASTLVWEKVQGEKATEPFKDEDVAAFGRTIIEITVESIAGRAHI